MAERNYTYLLRCADGTLYCGWTNDLDKRVAAHNTGAGAKYTKARRPVEPPRGACVLRDFCDQAGGNALRGGDQAPHAAGKAGADQGKMFFALNAKSLFLTSSLG